MPELRPLQKEALKKALHFLSYSRGFYNASEMGTGKSAVAIEAINHLQPENTLIICPSVVKLNWVNEINLWRKSNHVGEITLLNSSKDLKTIKKGGEFTILSYNLTYAKGVPEWINKQNFDCIVLDEAHYVKSTDSLRTKTILQKIWPKIPYRICLSGTPFTNSVLDCWTLFSRLAPNDFTDYYDFANRYCFKEITPWGPKYYGIQNHEELRAIIKKKFFFRYTLEEMASELPEVSWNRVSLPSKEYGIRMSQDDLDRHDEYLAILRDCIAKGKTPPPPPIHIATKRKEQGLKKLPAVIEFVKNYVDNNIPTVVFCVHLAVLNKLKEAFASYDPGVICGETREKDREKAIQNFQSGKTNLFLCQINAGGIGINLTRGSYCVFAEYTYSPAEVSQALARLQRIGQKGGVQSYYFVVERSIDEEIAHAVIGKSRTFNKVLKG